MEPQIEDEFFDAFESASQIERAQTFPYTQDKDILKLKKSSTSVSDRRSSVTFWIQTKDNHSSDEISRASLTLKPVVDRSNLFLYSKSTENPIRLAQEINLVGNSKI